jgi:hypothetical protein
MPMDGIYSITFRGAADWGMGMLILQNGQVTGADASGVTYDGTFVDTGPYIELHVTMSVPPGVALVQGVPAQSKAYTIPINQMIPKSAIETSQAILLQLAPGPVNVIFRRLRTLGA